MPASASAAESALLERDAELERLAALLSASSSGRGGLLVIEGQAGIGKTRLLESAQIDAASRGFTVARARGGSLEQEFAFGAARQLLEPPVAAAPDPDRLFTGAAASAASVFGRGGNGAAGEPGVVLHGLYWLTATLAEAQPLLLVCDDVHWFDGPSLRFIAYLARRVDELPVAVVLGTRPPESGPEGELLARLIADPATARLHPAPLTDPAVASLVCDALEGPAHQDFCQAVAGASRGNPFLVSELVRAARTSGLSASDADAASVLQLDVGAAVLDRIGRLPPPWLELARAVAVLGADAHLRHAAALSGLDIAAATEAADGLLRAEILGPERPLAFLHPLVASAVYNDLLPGDRSARHRRAAELLVAEAAPPERVAKHLLVAEPIGDHSVVATLRAAAAAALRQGATDVAVTCLRRALAEPPSAEERLGVVLELGAAEAFAVDSGAVEHLSEAIEAITDPATRVVLGTARSLQLIMDGQPSRAMAMLEELEGDVAGEAELELQLLAATVLLGMTGPTAAPLVKDKVDQLRAAIGPATDAPPSVLGVRSFVGAFANEPAEIVGAMASRALAALSPDDPTLPMWFHLPVTVLIMCDRTEEAAAVIEDGLRIGRRLGAPAHLGVTMFLRSWLAWRAGQLDDAEADATAALEMLSLYGVDFVIPGPLAILVLVYREHDWNQRADDLLTDWDYQDRDGDSMFHLFLLEARSRLRVATGRFDDTIADAQRGHERTLANGCVSPGFIPWNANLVVAEVLADRVSDASREHARVAIQLAEEFGAKRAIAEGLRAASMVDPDYQLEHAERAAALFAESGSPLEEARTIVTYAMAKKHVLARNELRALIERAYALGTNAGSERVVARSRELLAELGTEPRRRGLVGVDALTRSERRVATLVATGKTNKEVAQELFVTVKTVETPLAHIFQKLSISARMELSVALSG